MSLLYKFINLAAYCSINNTSCFNFLIEEGLVIHNREMYRTKVVALSTKLSTLALSTKYDGASKFQNQATRTDSNVHLIYVQLLVIFLSTNGLQEYYLCSLA